MTLLCVPIMVEDVEEGLRDARIARDAGADLLEYRVDQLFHGETDESGVAAIVRLVDESPLPCIVTCRSASEGGDYDGDDAGRVALWEHLGSAAGTTLSPKFPPRYLDIEHATYARSANLRQKVNLAVNHPAQVRESVSSLILSAHDFQGRPANLARLLADMQACPAARVLKLAWRARSIRDNLEAFELLRHRDRPTIALCMGEFGLMSRVLAPKFGGFLTFASLRDTAATAPGQPTISELTSLYRFRSIDSATRLFGVLGWPVGHSLSPAVHNAGFEARSENAVYLPLPVPPEWEHFKATLLALLDDPHLDFRGCSVTLPHKEHLVRLAREDQSRRWTIDPSAERCGAGNTLIVEDENSCRVINTDAPAAVAALAPALGGTVEGRRIAVIGSGGVARAVSAGLIEAGATVVVYGRSNERAQRLVEELTRSTSGGLDAAPGKVVAGPWEKLCLSCCEAYVNCTPVGMKGGPDEPGSVISQEGMRTLPAESVIFDTVYAPLKTPLLSIARCEGRPAIDGLRMFVEQAALQFTAWQGLGRVASDRFDPRRLFDRVARETLSARQA